MRVGREGKRKEKILKIRPTPRRNRAERKYVFYVRKKRLKNVIHGCFLEEIAEAEHHAPSRSGACEGREYARLALACRLTTVEGVNTAERRIVLVGSLPRHDVGVFAHN